MKEEMKPIEELPKKIRIGNMDYKIDREIHDGYHGFHVYGGDERRIIIDPRLTGERLENIFYHEIVHAMLYQIGAEVENENELFVQSLTNEIQKIFKLR